MICGTVFQCLQQNYRQILLLLAFSILVTILAFLVDKFRFSSYVFFVVIPIMSLLVVWLCCSSRKKVVGETPIDYELQRMMSGVPNVFSYKDLKTATNNFAHEIGKGGFGSVFRGSLKDGKRVAVKRLNRPEEGRSEFIAEVSTLASINHSNLVRLHGLCVEGSQCLLVYEYMDNGSLHDWLFNSSREPLDWKTRYSIALQTARGLAYLHDDSSRRILHLDVKPQNILLDENFMAKVSDFGLAKLLSNDESRVVSVHVRGTPGYIAPECILEFTITTKSDVYSYGMMLLEIVSGRRIVNRSEECEQWYLPSIALDKIKEGKMKELFDGRLPTVSAEAAVEMERVIKLGLWCIQSNSALRPSMSSVVQILEGSVEMLDPPLKFSLPFAPMNGGESTKSWEKCSFSSSLVVSNIE